MAAPCAWVSAPSALSILRDPARAPASSARRGLTALPRSGQARLCAPSVGGSAALALSQASESAAISSSRHARSEFGRDDGVRAPVARASFWSAACFRPPVARLRPRVPCAPMYLLAGRWADASPGSPSLRFRLRLCALGRSVPCVPARGAPRLRARPPARALAGEPARAPVPSRARSFARRDGLRWATSRSRRCSGLDRGCGRLAHGVRLPLGLRR
jgi:hypothetical protein